MKEASRPAGAGYADAVRAFQAREVCGLDFSGAAAAGRTMWLARADVRDGAPPLVRELSCVGDLAGGDGRDVVMAWLVREIAGSTGALWGIDAPFAFPAAVAGHAPFREVLRDVRAWPLDAPALGRAMRRRSLELAGEGRVKRATDREARTPFDPWHYRVIRQTYHVMRDVLAPLSRHPGSAILPFQYQRLPGAVRVVTETCPSSTLKLLRLPYHHYKAPAASLPPGTARAIREQILDATSDWIELPEPWREVALRDPGADALDAVLCAASMWHAWRHADHDAIASDERYVLEGFVYV
jgi:hypothetical protein